MRISAVQWRKTLSAPIEFKAKLACLYAGAVWGLFWIPLRALEKAGINALWITVVYFLIPTICLVPLILLRWSHVKNGGFSLQVTCILSGGSLLLYSTSIVYTEVVRAMLLFYLTPIWATLLARVFLGETITPSRLIAMVLAMIGMLTIFGLGVRFPIPENVGDWLGIAAGFFWAVAMVRIKISQSHSAVEMTTGFFYWSLFFAVSAAFLLAPTNIPKIEQALPALPLLIIFMVLLVLPGTYASLWGPKHLSPVIVGLLFMTEIVVGAISVAILAGEPFGIREITGILFIASASLLEPFLALQRPNKNFNARP